MQVTMLIQRNIAGKMLLAAVAGFLRLENLQALHRFDVGDILIVRLFL